MNADQLADVLAFHMDVESDVETEDLSETSSDSGDEDEPVLDSEDEESSEDEEEGDSESEGDSEGEDEKEDREESGEESELESEGEGEDEGVEGEGDEYVEDNAAVNPRKRHRWRSGTVALREIRKLQKTTDLLIPKTPFRRLVREVGQDFRTDLRFTEDAFLAIQTATEEMITELFGVTQLMAIHRDCEEILPKDMQMALATGRQFQWRL